MPRPREFDEQDVVARATDLFWRRGYHATSVRVLGEELDLSASSLYRTFSDKHALFLRALDRYRATESTETRDRLADAGPVPHVLREWLVRMVDGPEVGMSGRGCFVVNTATEFGTGDPDVETRTEAAFQATRSQLRSVMGRGVRNGELPSDLDVVAAADMLFTILLGLQVRARAGHDPADLRIVIDDAVRALGGDRPR